MSENDYPEKPSKTQLKNEMIELQKLGEELIKLPESQLSQIPIPEFLLDAINHARSLTAHGALRRQLQYIGRLMREIDPAPIQLALKQLQLKHQKSTVKFHQIEEWRDRLVAEGDDYLQEFMELFPNADRQKLRQLIRKAQHDRTKSKSSGADTEIFRYLQSL